MVPVCHVRMGLSGVRAPVWTASGMGYWRRLIKIPGSTDCYYCIIHMICSTYVYYCPFLFVTIPDMLSTIMSHVYLLHFLIFVTLHVVTHYSWTHILCLHIFYFMYTLQTSLLYTHNTIVWLCCMLHICMFIFITSSLYNILYDIKLDTTVDMTRYNLLGGDGITDY